VYAVLDTCTLISALRSSTGASYEILRAIRDGDIKIALSVALALEYESVALRAGLIPSLTEEEIKAIIDVLCFLSHHQKIFYIWRPFLSDPNDDLVLELAVAAGCEYIITHNLKDFKGSDSMKIQAVTPAQALQLI
jgi:putative PIN family toxin of toxin-antitoxin system